MKTSYLRASFISPTKYPVLINTVLKQHLQHVRENKMPVFKKQLPLESCYLWGLRSVAALFFTSIKGTTVHMYKTYGLNVVKTFPDR